MDIKENFSQNLIKYRKALNLTQAEFAEKLSKDALTDSLSSKVLNKQGFAERIVALGGTRKERVKSLVEASKGGKK